MSLEVDIRKKLRDFDLQVSFSEQRKRIGILGEKNCGILTCRFPFRNREKESAFWEPPAAEKA